MAKDFLYKLETLINESQQELDEGIYSGDYDIFSFMKECQEYIKQFRWIPVSEGLPKNTDEIWATNGMAKWIDWWSDKAKKWVFAGNLKVTHWMPIPKLPK